MKENFTFRGKGRIALYSAFSLLLFPAVAVPVASRMKDAGSDKEVPVLKSMGEGEEALGVSDPHLTIASGTKVISDVGGENNPMSNLVRKLAGAGENEEPTYPPLYYNDFGTQADWDAMTVINVNGDSETWHLNVSDARINNLDTPDTTMDDWMITPLFTLEEGKKYKIAYNARNGMSKWPERLGVYIGNDTTVAAMTNVLRAPELIIGYGWFDFEHSFVAPKTGKYCVGFHGCSDENTYNIHVDNISVSQYIPPSTPAAVTSMKVIPAENYDTRATITVTVPELDLEGQTLKENVFVTLARDDERIDTLKNVAPGASCTFTDTPSAPGVHVYSVRVGNNIGEGPATTVESFVGVNLPANVGDVSYKENGNTGQVTVTWTPVTTDTAGNTIPQDKVKYSLYDYASGNRTLLAEGLTGTSYTFQLVKAGEQHVKQLAIWATTAFGESLLGCGSNKEFVGTPYAGGFVESFANGYLSHDIMVATLNNYAAAGMATDGRFANYRSSDDDNGFIYYLFKAYNDAGALEFGKVSLAGMEKPALSFYVYNVVGADGSKCLNEMKVQVRECGQEDYTDLVSGPIYNLCQNIEGWGRVTVPLDAYKGKNIEFRLVGTAKSLTMTYLDNVRVESMKAKDLKAHQISVPSKVNPGDNYEVSVTVANDGQDAATGYTVELYCNGEKVAEKRGEDVAPAKRATVKFEMQLPKLAEELLNYYAVVKFDGDEYPDNNQTKTFTLRPLVSKLPAVTNLGLADQEDGVVMTWNEPAYQDGIPTDVTDDFESGEPFAHSFEDWTFVDVDDSPLGAIAGAPFPGFYLNITKASFFVVDNTDLPSYFADRFRGHSGTQYLGAMLRYDDMPTDDWAISPKLSGKKQTVKFWAKRFLPNTDQKIDVLYSTGSLNTDDFVATSVKDYQVPNEWTLVTAEIPEGAKHFAIWSHTRGGLLMIDDVTYQRVYERNLKLKGYNLWRDGEKINSEVVTDRKYTDIPTGGKHTYRVTAVYEQGESAGCDAVDINVSGVDIVTGGLDIATWRGNIRITTSRSETVTLYDLSGRRVYSDTINGTTHIELESGIYILKAGGRTIKVAI